MYSAAPILRYAISIGMTRLYTSWLGRSAYGVKDNADLWLMALQQVLGHNLLASMVRFYYDHKAERDRAGVVTSCTLVVTLSALVFSGLALFFVPQLTPLLLGRGEAQSGVSASELTSICTLLILLLPFQLATLSGLYYLQTLKRSGLYTAVQTTKLLLEVALSFYWIGALGYGVRGFLLAMLAGEVLSATLLCGWMLWTLKPRIEWRLLKPVLSYAAPMIPVGLLQLLLHSFDKRLVLEYGSQALAGTYALGYKIALLMSNLVLGPFIQTWQPWIFGVESRDERARLVARVGTYAVLAVGVSSLGVILFGRQATQVLAASSFWEAYKVSPIVAVGYVFWALYHVAQTPLFIDKRTGRLLAVNFLAVALNVGLNVWLIPLHGIVGAAVATLVTFIVLAALGIVVGRRMAGVTFELARLGTTLACVLVGGAFALWIDHLEDANRCSVWLAIASKGALLAALILVLWFAVLRAEERARFLGWVASRRRATES